MTSELVVAEADHLILDRLGVDVELAFVEDLAAGTFVLECLGRDDMQAARQLIEPYRDLRLGPADASLVVRPPRYAPPSPRILSFDESAFRPVAPLQGGSFTILPGRPRRVGRAWSPRPARWRQ